MMDENWPRIDHRASCGCRSCLRERRMVERLADRSLSVALRHAQSRFENSAFEEETEEAYAAIEGQAWIPPRLAPEAIIDKDINVTWGRHRPLTDFLRDPGPAAELGRQWLYRFFVDGDPRPLYLGRVTGARTSLRERIGNHVNNKVSPFPSPPGLSHPQMLDYINAEIARQHSLSKPSAVRESLLMDQILKTIPLDRFRISVAEVTRLGGRTGTLPGRPADTALAEKYYHRRRVGRINRPSSARFEEEWRADRL